MDPPRSVHIVADVDLAPDAAFGQVVDELVEALTRVGLQFEPGPNGSATEAGQVVGRIRAWQPGRGLVLDWGPAPWNPERRVEVELRVDARGGGARIDIEQRGLDALLDGDPAEWTGWIASAVVAPFLRAIAPSGFGDWLTDRRARRPSGPAARATYADPRFHRPNFLLLLDTLRPGPNDDLLEVGCGGGAFLQEVLARGARAVGIDHSPEMVRLARARNEAAVRDGRLRVIEADGSRLPVPDASFSIAMSTGAFGFLPRPLDTLREMRRALRPGGRLAVFAGTKELIGTPACPEPMASRIHFFEDGELGDLARAAGFTAVEVRHPPLLGFAEQAGIPTEALDLFRGTNGSQLLVARRPDG
jgi:SAM-dependent methyltransferase